MIQRKEMKRMNKKQILFAFGPNACVYFLNLNSDSWKQDWEHLIVEGRVDGVLTRTVGEGELAHEIFDFNIRGNDGTEYRYTYDPTVSNTVFRLAKNTSDAKKVLTFLFDQWEMMANRFIESRRQLVAAF